MIESKDNAENKIHHVISAAILKNAILGTFFPSKFHVLIISNLAKNFLK